MSDEWFFKSSGEEVGPVPFERLREYASTNQLSPHDHVRSGDSGEWIEARRFSHLFENPLADTMDHPAEETSEISIDDFQIVSEETASPLASLEELGIQISHEPTGPPPEKRHAVDSREADDQWVCHVLGVQLGPMPLDDLRLLAKKGEISLDDDVRRLEETEWRPAKSVEGLFPGFDFQSDYDLPVTEARVIAESPNLPQLSDDIDQAMAGLSSVETDEVAEPRKPVAKASPAPEERPVQVPKAQPTPAKKNKQEELEKWLSDAVPVPEPPPSANQESKAAQPAEPSPVTATDSRDRAAQLRAEFEARAAQTATFTPPPRVSPAKSPKSSGSGSGIQFSDLFEKIKNNPKVWGVFAVLALVLLIKYVPWSFGPDDQTYLDQITQYTNKYKELRAKKASPAEFEQLKQEGLAVITPMKAELLKRGAGTRDRPKQEMLWACGKLEELLKAGESAEPTETEKTLDGHIASARALIQGTPIPTENPKDEPPSGSADPE